MDNRDLGPQILRWFLDRPDGAYAWDVEAAFPDRLVKKSLSSLVTKGLLREARAAAGVTTLTRYYRTGKELGPQQKLTAFVEVEA
jgi:hypothetical protein